MKNKSQQSKSNETIIDMPEVKDIPGQEHIKPPRIREMMDTTISSAGEEGEGLLDDLNRDDDDTTITDDASNVSRQEKKLLSRAGKLVNAETEDLRKLALDRIDDDDSVEKGDPSDMGADLDIPGAELDDANEDIGEEDEENNAYSRND